MEIEIQFEADEKGYFDRECPNENCLFNFKINTEDWKEKVSDEEVHCPKCGFVAPADKWWTQTQVDRMHEIVLSYATSYAQEELGKAFKDLERSTKNNKYVQIKYEPGQRISFVNNPIGASKEWEQDITCEKCGTRYSVIGSAFFCPCCGYNSASRNFEESMDIVKKMIDSLPEMKDMLMQSYNLDKAETICRGMLEGCIGDIVAAFQKFAHARYLELSGKSLRSNDFQIVEKGSSVFHSICGFDYAHWLSDDELTRMNIYFQRRHLLEHNGGIVDQKYVEKSGDLSYTVGQRLIIKNSDVLDLITIVQKLGKGLLSINPSEETK